MTDGAYTFLFGVITGLLLATAAVGLVISNYGNYRDGQVDALNGRVYYELVRQEDGSTEWNYVPDGVEWKCGD